MAVVTLFGATGKTGKRVLQRALAAGHYVRVLVRTPSKLEVSDPRLTVLEGDVLDPQAVDNAVAEPMSC